MSQSPCKNRFVGLVPMKSFMILCVFLLTTCVFAQMQEFDVIVHQIPAGYKVSKTPDTLIYTKEDSTTGAFCALTLVKSQASKASSNENFKSFWKTLVQGAVKAGNPEVNKPTSDNGWTLESGSSTFELEGHKGIALLITATGHGRVANLLVLTNTDAYKDEIQKFVGTLSLKKPAGTTPIAKPQPQTKKGNFQFTTTNFDDGWTSTEDSDWVTVSKGNLKVLVHYPNKAADEYNSVLKTQTQRAWNTLVAPRYSGIQNFADRSIQSFESIGFAEASAIDKASGKKVYVVLFKKHKSQGDGKYIEFITDSKATFEREFMTYRNEEFGWEKLENFVRRNRFAVASADLTGIWATNTYASLTYYYVSSGRVAGATATSTADEYKFLAGGKYSSDHSGASGQVGNARFSRQTYSGSYTSSDWSIKLTNRFKGEAETFDCYFESVKGGRILVLKDRNNTFFYLAKQ